MPYCDKVPHSERIEATSSCSVSSNGHMMPGNREANMVFPVPGGPASGGRYLQRPFGMFLAQHLIHVCVSVFTDFGLLGGTCILRELQIGDCI